MASSWVVLVVLAAAASATITPQQALTSCRSDFITATTPEQPVTTTVSSTTTPTTATTTPRDTTTPESDGTTTTFTTTTTTTTKPNVATVAPAIVCAAFHQLSLCAARVVAASEGDSDIQDQIYTLLQYALSIGPNCSLSMQPIMPQLRENFGSINFETGASQTFTFNRYIRDPISLNDIDATLETLRENHLATTNRIAAALNQLPVSSSNMQIANVKVVAPIAAAVVGNAGGRLAGLESLLSGMERVAARDLPASINILSGSVSSAIASESLARANTNVNMNSLVGAVSTNINTRFDAATSVRTAVKAVMSEARVAILNAGTVDFNAQVAIENSRAVAEASTLTSTASWISTMATSALSTAIVRESSRADANCTTYMGTIGGGVAVQTGSTDHGSCSTAGTLYFSSANKTLFFCAGNTMTNNAYMMGSFYDSVILNAAQRSSLATLVGPRWILCYRAIRDGFNTYAFHALCGWKGPTVTIGITTGGRIYGAYTEVFWGNKNQYVPAPDAFLYRFNPSSTNAATIDRVTPKSGSIANAMYDYYSYPPTFGGGHDLYMGSNGQSSAYSSPSSYQAACGVTFDNAFLTGSSGWSNSNIEVYYNM